MLTTKKSLGKGYIKIAQAAASFLLVVLYWSRTREVEYDDDDGFRDKAAERVMGGQSSMKWEVMDYSCCCCCLERRC